MFTQMELNLRQIRWLELLNDFDISFLYEHDKANVVVYSLSRMTMGRVSHIDKTKKDLEKDLHSFARLAVRLEDSLDGGFMDHNNSES